MSYAEEAGPPPLRASDSERDRVAARLQRETAAGRLTLAEFEERIGVVYHARTRDQLVALTADLPAEAPPAIPASSATSRGQLLCVLCCVFPPAGLVYWLYLRRLEGLPRAEPLDRTGSLTRPAGGGRLGRR